MLVAVNGDLGSGKSELVKRLSALTGWQTASMGAIQRSVAERLGISTLEMNRRAETDPTMDDLLRREVEKLASVSADTIIDSRLAFHFLPDALSLHLLAHPNTAAKRVLGIQRGSVETYADIDDAQKQLAARRGAERERYRSKFGVAIQRLENYDLVVQTDLVTQEDVCEVVSRWIQGPSAKGASTRILLNPMSLLPAAGDGTDLMHSVHSVSILRVDDASYVVRGVQQLVDACQAAEPFIAVSLLAQDDDEVDGRSARQIVASASMAQRAEAWEKRSGLKANSGRFS
jgi:cytidylate kinase